MTETNEKVEPKPIDLGEYKYGFHDDVTPVFSTGKGISEDVVRAMSAEKGEPEWMLEFRLKSLETFKKMPMQEWGPDLSEIDFDDLTYFKKRQTDLLVTGKMYLKKSRKPLNVLVSPKLNVLTWQGLQLSMNQKWFTTT